MENRNESSEMGYLCPEKSKVSSVECAVNQLGSLSFGGRKAVESIKNITNSKFTKMKTNTFIYTVIIALFSLTIVSCDKEPIAQPQPVNKVSIHLDNLNRLKDGEEDDDVLLDDLQVVKGKVLNIDETPAVSVDVLLRTASDKTLVDQTQTSSEGDFQFYVSIGSYLIEVREDGHVLGSLNLVLD